MNLKNLMFLAAMTAKPQEENLLDYGDLVNKNYGGSANAYNVRPENKIAVTPGSSLVMTCELWVNEFDVRFYSEDGTYQSDKTLSVYGDGSLHVDITVPGDSYFILPKWHKSDGLSVETLVAANPIIKYI